ncbi:hypothetical protein ACI2OX_16740 [Bacillus sp. N9]
MKRLIPVIPVVIAVAVMSMWILERNFSEIDVQTRMLIAAGGTVLSGVLSYFYLAVIMIRMIFLLGEIKVRVLMLLLFV